MQFTAQQISELVNGIVDGNPNETVTMLSRIEDAESGTLAFLSNPKYEQYLYTTDASIVIVNSNLKLQKETRATLIRVTNAYSAFSLLLEQYNSLRLNKLGIEEPNFIHPTAKIGENVYIGAFVYIGENVSIGDDAKIYPHTYIGDNVTVGNGCTFYAGIRIYHDCAIGENVIIHSGAVIGSDGFGFAPQADGTYHKISQIGNVIIEENVEIGANTTVDRATMGSTFIRKGVKLDNLVQMAHNTDVGTNTVVAAQSGVSGSTKIGENVIIGGQVGIAGHLSISNKSQIQAQSGINRSIEEENKKWAGTPAGLYASQMRVQVTLSRLPELEKRIIELEKLLNKSL